MTGFFERMLGRNPARGSSKAAKERLQVVLVHDRMNLPPEQLEAMKQEILEVIARYVSFDASTVEIALEQRNRDSLLVAEIPFSNHREVSRVVDDQDDDLDDNETDSDEDNDLDD